MRSHGGKNTISVLAIGNRRSPLLQLKAPRTGLQRADGGTALPTKAHLAVGVGQQQITAEEMWCEPLKDC